MFYLLRNNDIFFVIIIQLKKIHRTDNRILASDTVIKSGGTFIPDGTNNEEQVGDGDQNAGFEA